jgi:uncharacterized lipoprotein NlpE involved in copper resistance
MNRLYILAAAALLCIAGCGKKENGEPRAEPIDAAHNSRLSVDWAGLYTGRIPAASGPGIDVRLRLNDNETYTIRYRYVERGDEVFDASGMFRWMDDGNRITLDTNDFPKYYQVAEGRVIQLDREGQPITGLLAENYILVKNKGD